MDTIYWYDYETTGIDPARDRVIQFAGIRTDRDLNIMGEPLELFCRLSDEIVPHPEALMVSGIKLSSLQEKGLTEREFAESIYQEFSKPNTCVVGYNSIRFDDEFTRYLLYRNFYDPYAREWQSGNSRWDVIDLFRTAWALRPEGMNWPTKEDGAPVFKLEVLTKANGITHQKAHDAVSDVIATIDLVRKLRLEQSRLYDYFFDLRTKRNVLQQLYPLGKSAIIHVSGRYPAIKGCCAIVLPLCTHPTNSNGIICYDLSVDPAPLIELSPEEIKKRLFVSSQELEEGISRIPLKTIHINRSPSVSPLSTLKGENEQRLGLNSALCLEHMHQIQTASGMVEKIQEVFSGAEYEQYADPDLMLYQGGFFSNSDRLAMDEVRSCDPQTLRSKNFGFADERLDEMLFRYRARNFRQSLTEKEDQKWKAYCHQLWQSGYHPDKARLRIEEMKKEHPDRSGVLDDLDRYLANLKSGTD